MVMRHSTKKCMGHPGPLIQATLKTTNILITRWEYKQRILIGWACSSFEVAMDILTKYLRNFHIPLDQSIIHSSAEKPNKNFSNTI